MDHRKESSLESDYALALEYSRVAELMMRTVASRAIGGLDETDIPARFVPLKFLLDSEFFAFGSYSRAECRAKYVALVNDFGQTMTKLYDSKRDKMEDSGSWTGFSDLWSEWFEFKLLLGKLRIALFLYDLGLHVAVKMARRAGAQALELCPRAHAPGHSDSFFLRKRAAFRSLSHSSSIVSVALLLSSSGDCLSAQNIKKNACTPNVIVPISTELFRVGAVMSMTK